MKKIKFLALFLLSALFLFPQSAFAQAGGASALGGFLPLILIFAFFYLFLIRPQQKKNKQHQMLLNNLKKDDKVITSGGIYGTVAGVKDNIVELKIAEGVNIQISKPAISAVLLRKPEEAVSATAAPVETASSQVSDIIKK
ncbi:MAG: preprotein translocase subunit YajC [Elusimicrobiota bacterium]|jgi:preprotein translocase subunit YajC|nr:preprotein translocase subunit YajC [Elusimicrobiota bacterium]